MRRGRGLEEVKKGSQNDWKKAAHHQAAGVRKHSGGRGGRGCSLRGNGNAMAVNKKREAATGRSQQPGTVKTRGSAPASPQLPSHHLRVMRSNGQTTPVGTAARRLLACSAICLGSGPRLRGWSNVLHWGCHRGGRGASVEYPRCPHECRARRGSVDALMAVRHGQ